MCVNWKFSKFIVNVARERENLKLFDGDRLNNIDKMPFTPGRVHILSFSTSIVSFLFLSNTASSRRGFCNSSTAFVGGREIPEVIR